MNLTAKERERFDFAVIANWIPQGERVLDTEMTLSDFRPAGGILFAHRVETRFRVAVGGAPAAFGEPSVFIIEKIATDSELPDSLFAFPLPVKPAPAAASAPPR